MYDVYLLKNSRIKSGVCTYLLISSIMLMSYYCLALTTAPDTTGTFNAKVEPGSFFRVSKRDLTSTLTAELLNSTVATIIATNYPYSTYDLLCDNGLCEIRVYGINSKQAFHIMSELHEELEDY